MTHSPTWIQKGQRGETKGLALARLKRIKKFDVDSTSLKIFPCLTHTQTFDRRPFPMYSQHELCRWKNTTSAPWACLITHVVFLAQLMSENKLWE